MGAYRVSPQNVKPNVKVYTGAETPSPRYKQTNVRRVKVPSYSLRSSIMLFLQAVSVKQRNLIVSSYTGNYVLPEVKRKRVSCSGLELHIEISMRATLVH